MGQGLPAHQPPTQGSRGNQVPLEIWFGNVEKWGPAAESFISAHSAKVWIAAETHLRSDGLASVAARFPNHALFAAPAFLTGRSEEGTHAGLLALVSREIFAVGIDEALLKDVCGQGASQRRWCATVLRLSGGSVLVIGGYFVSGQILKSEENLVILSQIRLVIL